MFGSVKRFFFLKKNGGVSLRRVIVAVLRRIVHIPDFIRYFFPFGFPLKNRRKIERYKDLHKGKRCFIIANGPSLKKINFDLLKDEITIGMNRIYLMEKENGFKPNYLICIDLDHLEQSQDEYDNITVPCFYNWETRGRFSKKDNQNFLLHRMTPNFYENLKKGVGCTSSVVYVTIQLAYYMGCTEVYLIGKDHFYKINAKSSTDIKSDGKEDNHFIKGYLKPGMTWASPDYKSEEYTYSIAKEYFDKNNRVIKDATIGGKLQVFPKVDYYSLFHTK
jgi:hypothetical protein